MRICIRSSCFLILFTIFSISILLSSAVAQSLPVVQGTYGSPSLPVVQGTYGSPSLPVVQGTYGSPPGQGLPPSQSALEAAKRAKQEAEQQVTTAQSALEQANAAKLSAEEQLASAQTALETATAAEQAALAANAEQLQVAQAAVEQAQQAADAAQAALDQAKQQLADAQAGVSSAETKNFATKKQLRDAVAKLNQLKAGPTPPPVNIDNVVFATTSPNISGVECGVKQKGGDTKEEIVDNNVYSSWLCKGYAALNFNLNNRQAINAIKVYTVSGEKDSSGVLLGGNPDQPNHTGINSYEVVVDDKSVFYGYPDIDESCTGPDTSAGGPVNQIPFPCVVINFPAVVGERITIYTDDGSRNTNEPEQQIKAYQWTKVAEVTMETGTP
jgi:hypothetical protein